MASIEPGEPFRIEYGKGHKLDVVALSQRQFRRMIAISTRVANGSPDDIMAVMDEMEACLKMCSPSITEERIETLDSELIMEIIAKTMSKAKIDGDDEKKSDSPL